MKSDENQKSRRAEEKEEEFIRFLVWNLWYFF